MTIWAVPGTGRVTRPVGAVCGGAAGAFRAYGRERRTSGERSVGPGTQAGGS